MDHGIHAILSAFGMAIPFWAIVAIILWWLV